MHTQQHMAALKHITREACNAAITDSVANIPQCLSELLSMLGIQVLDQTNFLDLHAIASHFVNRLGPLLTSALLPVSTTCCPHYFQSAVLIPLNKHPTAPKRKLLPRIIFMIFVISRRATHPVGSFILTTESFVPAGSDVMATATPAMSAAATIA
jgi:hypothetical protein